MGFERIEVALRPVYIEQSNEFLGKARLRRFQRKVADVQDGAIIFTAPTGSGKTVALLTDTKRMTSIGFYPNNELLLSQIAGLHNFVINYLNMKPIERGLLDYAMMSDEIVNVSHVPYNLYEGDSEVDVFGQRVKRLCILGLSGKIVKRIGEKGKLDVLRDTVKKLTRLESTYKIVLATPDTYFLLALYAYRDFRLVSRILLTILSTPPKAGARYIEDVLRMSGLAPREELTKVISVLIPIRDATIFIDEYHLYDIYELSSFKVLMYVLKEVHGWDGRLIFSSATPNIESAKVIAEEANLQLRELNALEDIREGGDAESLVRGGIKLIFLAVDTGRRSKVGRAYGASERAPDLLGEEEVKDFVELYKGGSGRGMIILEKVSHADAFAEEMYKTYNIKPICLFSTAPPDFPTTIPETARDEGRLIIVGTGARIGQGVEFRNVTFGIVTRVVSYDYLQSLSRIGRKCLKESIVLTPIDVNSVNELEKEIKTIMDYRDLVTWIEETKVFLRSRMRELNIYKSLIDARNHLLRLMSLALFYRHSGTWTDEVRRILESFHNVDMRILSSPDEVYGLTMFRSTGPEVTFYRSDVDVIERSDDLGTLIRNYVLDVDVHGNLALVKRGRGELVAKCDEKSLSILRGMAESGLPIMATWSFLEKVFKCSVVDDHGDRLDSASLEGQLFMVIDTNDSDIAEFLAATGRGLRIDVGRGKRTLVLVFV